MRHRPTHLPSRLRPHPSHAWLEGSLALRLRRGLARFALIAALGVSVLGPHLLAETPAKEGTKTAQTTPPPAGNAEPQAPTRLPSSIPLRRDPETALATRAMGSFQVLAVMILVAAIVLWYLRKRNLSGDGGAPFQARDWRKWLTPTTHRDELRVIQSARLNPKVSLHVFRWDAKEWLVGCNENGLTLLGQRPTAGDGKPLDGDGKPPAEQP